MTHSDAPLLFTCDKRPAMGDAGMVVTNAPLGSLAGSAMLAAGGNAIDAAVAALLTLTVVEPMMVGIAGGGISHLRLADGRHVVIDALSVAGQGARADMFTPLPDRPPDDMDTLDRRNLVGPSAVAVPGNLRGWYMMQQRHGRLPWADVVEPAIQAAARGFAVSPYLNGALAEHADDLSADPGIAALMLPGGAPAPVGSRMVMGAYADSLRLVQAEGDPALHGGALGRALVERLATGGPDAGHVTLADLEGYRAVEREAITGSYRGHAIAGPPPPASSGVHVVQMLNMLEAHDVGALGFGTPAALHLLAEVIRVGFEDRRAASGDPAFVDVPVARYISKAYAADCQGRLRARGGAVGAQPEPPESGDTTHVTVADRDGNIVTATHTLNGLFGARIMVPGTGIIPNNYMVNYDPRPGLALSIAPGKRVPTSMAPMIVLRDGRPVFALGLPGGVRIFPSALQAIVNLIDHGMSLQQAVEAPRLWTQGGHVELEPAYAPMRDALRAMGHEVQLPRTIGGGMTAIGFAPDGMMTGAACWRADGTVLAHGGGLARPGIRFKI
ncbi:gamma-glutamyltransferase [Paracoccus liaowanqingii]|uniref:Glutathione hydrolase proenzyme n=1 Tax=Paracoccus liaowanqingii TaxID=2560053 RepID=A0A4Z1CAR6_9RHOB|nr:gamma-glutamyltransferase [Paracoccus liaowanqingii]TGN55703.1 gamma-glutamyltransferase [Paracoccus liaowanqingii]